MVGAFNAASPVTTGLWEGLSASMPMPAGDDRGPPLVKETAAAGGGDTVAAPAKASWRQTAGKVARCAAKVFIWVSLGCVALPPLILLSPLIAIVTAAYYVMVCCGRKAAAAGAAAPTDAAPTDETAPSAQHVADLRVSNHVGDSFEWKKKLAASATQTIDFCGIYAGGPPFQEFLDVVEERLQQAPQLRVRIMASPTTFFKGDEDRLERLEQEYPGRFSYITCKPAMGWHNKVYSRENHVKLLVVDKQYFVIGGTGVYPPMVREDYDDDDPLIQPLHIHTMDRAFRDSDLIGCGEEVAEDMTQGFQSLWDSWQDGNDVYKDVAAATTLPPKGRCDAFHDDEGLVTDAKVKFVLSQKKADGRPCPIAREIKQLIAGSHEEINIANWMFSPPQDILDTLADKKAAGVHLIGHHNRWDFKHHPTHALLALQSRRHYGLYDEVYEYDVAGQQYHKKVYLFDRQKAVIGSQNFSTKSFDCDYGDDEAVVVIDDSRVVQQLEDGLLEDEQRSVHLQGAALDSLAAKSKVLGKGLQMMLGPVLF